MEWQPMEINPEMLNKVLSGLGVCGSWGFVDVLGLEDEGVSSVPSPSCALMLLFPLTQQHESFRQQQAGKVSGGTDLYFLKQTVVNSCGTVALLHAVANNPTHIEYDGDSALKKFLDETANMTPAQRATHLENNQFPPQWKDSPVPVHNILRQYGLSSPVASATRGQQSCWVLRCMASQTNMVL
ncbi:ubiquitin carboxyl-terminal hydrolase isozyme L1 isoform X2 [Oncorhynchus kisutch]|uniref:ubiquitin carboxyl-terminal hydrolase isozyme L1-like isoform X2 n=1 Tax=Oncorhynchus kisutch TaxID=8019 RepID=UPI0012DF12BD|nr:ubiquitin carboxyl-terminal hydrolase isozyme L1-like isoform X2 [Oncorhynchus kisutch]XP_031677368.1 ubiquitin carboxyl-terminal hydrolase isozyme L1-like isoform X2 [Oncorhynchus kisutch]